MFTTGFYDIYTGGIFDMWNALSPATKALSALAVHPFDHGGSGINQPIRFENGVLSAQYPNYAVRWCDHIRLGTPPPFTLGQVTYYTLFSDTWMCDSFSAGNSLLTIPLGQDKVTYRYNPYDPATFPGGLSANFGGNAWQNKPNLRHDVISLYTEPFPKDVFVRGKISARLRVQSTCEDTCFYLRISLAKKEGDYGLRDDINMISNFNPSYIPNESVDMAFAFDEHAFVICKGERLRLDISSSADPHYVRHTNHRGLFSEQTTARIADNTVLLSDSSLTLPTVPEKGDNEPFAVMFTSK